MAVAPLRIVLAYNPALPRTRARRVEQLARTLTARGHAVDHRDSALPDLARAAAAADLLVLAGGDGTVRLVLERAGDALLPPLAIYPIGTINLLARELRYSRDPDAFARRIEQAGAATAVRPALIDGVPFLACASAGFDAHAVAALSEQLKLRVGRLAYLVAALALLRAWPRTGMTVSADGRSFTAEALFVLRGRFYAGPWTLDRAATLTAPLRLLALPRARRRDVVRLLLHALAGARGTPRHWLSLSCQTLEIASREPLPVQADGDVVAHLPVRITLADRGVSFR